MTKIHLYEGPRHGTTETIEGDEANIRLGILWVFPRATNKGIVTDKYRITAGPDDCGDYAASYMHTEEY